MTVTVKDELFEYKDFNGRTAHCHVRHLTLDRRTQALIVSELAENPGMSISNAFSSLLAQLVEVRGVDPRRLFYVEHWGSFSYAATDRCEEFSIVTCEIAMSSTTRLKTGSFHSVRRHAISRGALEQILGCKLPPISV